jgi:uncharacterized pyridoxal phosphate-containing UPF0001 family protein
VAAHEAVRYSQRMAAAAANSLEHVRTEIARACRDAQRDLAEVTLIAVSKTFSPDAIEPVVAAGQWVFGENRVQEAKAKWPPLLSKHPGIDLHLIGPLQSNKTKEAVALFKAIHSVDRPSLCEAWPRIAHRARPTLFVEVNTGASRRRQASCRKMPMHSLQPVAINTGWGYPASCAFPRSMKRQARTLRLQPRLRSVTASSFSRWG